MGNSKLTLIKQVHFDAEGELHVTDRTPEISKPERVLYKGDYELITSSGDRLTITLSSKCHILDLADHAIAADFMRLDCRPFAIVATRTMLRLIKVEKDEAVVLSSAIIKNEISSMSKVTVKLFSNHD